MVAPSIAASISIPLDAFTVVAAPPIMLSQLNVEAVVAVSVRVYLEAIRAPGFPLPVMKLGKLRLVECAGFVAWLRSQTAAGAAPANDGEPLGHLGLVAKGAQLRATAGR